MNIERASIASVQIENRSIQDMYIFGDPSHVPIVIVEDAVNAPIRVMRRNSYISRVDQNEKNGFFPRFGTDPENALVSTRPDGRSLRIVIFVHGFQARTKLPIMKLVHAT